MHVCLGSQCFDIEILSGLWMSIQYCMLFLNLEFSFFKIGMRIPGNIMFILNKYARMDAVCKYIYFFLVILDRFGCLELVFFIVMVLNRWKSFRTRVYRGTGMSAGSWIFLGTGLGITLVPSILASPDSTKGVPPPKDSLLAKFHEKTGSVYQNCFHETIESSDLSFAAYLDFQHDSQKAIEETSFGKFNRDIKALKSSNSKKEMKKTLESALEDQNVPVVTKFARCLFGTPMFLLERIIFFSKDPVGFEHFSLSEVNFDVGDSVFGIYTVVERTDNEILLVWKGEDVDSDNSLWIKADLKEFNASLTYDLYYGSSIQHFNPYSLFPNRSLWLHGFLSQIVFSSGKKDFQMTYLSKNSPPNLA